MVAAATPMITLATPFNIIICYFLTTVIATNTTNDIITLIITREFCWEGKRETIQSSWSPYNCAIRVAPIAVQPLSQPLFHFLSCSALQPLLIMPPMPVLFLISTFAN